MIIKLIVFYYAGHCHRSWYSVSFSDLVALFHSATLSLLIIATLDKLFVHNIHPPRGVLVLDWALTILVLGGLRAVGRLSREELSPRLWRSGYRKALIVGANQSGETLARHLLSDRRLKYQPVGYLDHDPARVGSTLGGIPVWGDPSQALHIANRLGVEDMLVISGVLTGSELRTLMEGCADGRHHAQSHSGLRRSAGQQLLAADSRRRHQRLAAPRAGAAQQRRDQHACWPAAR